MVNVQHLCPQGKQWRRSMRQVSYVAGMIIRFKWTLSKRIGVTGHSLAGRGSAGGRLGPGWGLLLVGLE